MKVKILKNTFDQRIKYISIPQIYAYTSIIPISTISAATNAWHIAHLTVSSIQQTSISPYGFTIQNKISDGEKL